MEKLLTLWDKYNVGELRFELLEAHSLLYENTIQFNENDIWTYLNTPKTFDLRFYINDREFQISSNIIDLLEGQFNTNFHKTLYSINLINF